MSVSYVMKTYGIYETYLSDMSLSTKVIHRLSTGWHLFYGVAVGLILTFLTNVTVEVFCKNLT